MINSLLTRAGPHSRRIVRNVFALLALGKQFLASPDLCGVLLHSVSPSCGQLWSSFAYSFFIIALGVSPFRAPQGVMSFRLKTVQ